MRIEFPFAREKSQLFGTIFRPIARVVLNDRFPNIMYLDSGADISLLPRSVGELIGLEREKDERPEQIFGVGQSSVGVFVRQVTMRIGESRFRARVAWSRTEDVPMLLGRLDVFRRFNISFQERKRTVRFAS